MNVDGSTSICTCGHSDQSHMTRGGCRYCTTCTGYHYSHTERAGASYPAPAQATGSSLTHAGGRSPHLASTPGREAAETPSRISKPQFHLGDRVQARTTSGRVQHGVVFTRFAQMHVDDLYVVKWDDDPTDQDYYPESMLSLSDEPMPRLRAVA